MIGTIITMPMCGAIIPALGWDAAFYITGTFSIIWGVIWVFTAKDNPQDHPRYVAFFKLI